jgi:hypothetical protein
MIVGIGEVLKSVSEARTNEEKVAILRKHDSEVLRMMIQLALDPRIEWLFPPAPESVIDPDTGMQTKLYKPNRALDCEGNLFQEIRKMYLYLKGMNSPFEEGGEVDHEERGTAQKQKMVKRWKREGQFIQLLEFLAPLDAEVMLMATHKKLPWGIQPSVIQAAFPGLINVEEPAAV